MRTKETMTREEIQKIVEDLKKAGMDASMCVEVPMYETMVACGVPSDIYTDCISAMPIPDVMALEGAFCVHVKGDSMTEAGIIEGDTLLVRGTKMVQDGDIVLADNDGGYTVKLFFQRDDGCRWLLPVTKNRSYVPINMDEEENIRIVGRVECVIKKNMRMSYRVCNDILCSYLVQEPKEVRELTREIIREAIEQVMVDFTSGSSWFAIYRVLVDRKVLKDGDFTSAEGYLKELCPDADYEPSARSLARLCVDCFAKPWRQWSQDKAPISGKRYNDMYNLARVFNMRLR